jgi:phasin family protein
MVCSAYTNGRCFFYARRQAAQFRAEQEKQMTRSAHTEIAQHHDDKEQRETVGGPLESGLSNVIGTFQQMTDRFSEMWGFSGPRAEEMTRRSSQNIEAVSQAGTMLTKGAQEVSRQWFDLIQDRLVKNLDAMNKLAGCRSLQDLVAVQTEIARDRFGQAVESSRRIAEISVRVTDEAARVIQSQAGRNAVELDKKVVPVRRVA